MDPLWLLAQACLSTTSVEHRQVEVVVLSSMTETVSVSRGIAAPAEEVWALVTDLTAMGRWSPENRGGTWIDGATGPAVGARFRGRNGRGKRAWSTVVTVSECDQPRRFAFELRIGRLGGADWIYDIEPVDQGCLVTETWVDRRTWLLARIGTLVTGVSDRATHNRDGMVTTLENLALACEDPQ